MVPKVDSPDELSWVFEQVAEVNTRGIPLRLIIMIESAIGLINIREICDVGAKLSHDGLNLQAIIFGSDDFAADIGATRSVEAKEVLLARQTVVCYAKAFGLQAIDMVNIELGEDYEDKLRHESQDGAMIGFTGKQCIHPKVSGRDE